MINYGEYALGRVVKISEAYKGWKKYGNGMYGHIVGFSEVEYDHGINVIVLVRWCDGTERSIHPSNIELV